MVVTSLCLAGLQIKREFLKYVYELHGNLTIRSRGFMSFPVIQNVVYDCNELFLLIYCHLMFIYGCSSL